jgi:hypothetical protein
LIAPVAGAAASPAHVSKAAAPGSITIRLLDAAVSRKNDPRARIYIDDNVKPGTTMVRHIEVSNSASHAVSLRYYATSASIANGSFAVAAGQTSNDLTSWTTVSPAAGSLPAGGHVVLTVTVAVPKDAQPGERYAVVLADVPPTASSGIALGARVGIRMYLSVARGAEPITNFAITSLTGVRLPSGQPEVKAEVHNTGGRAVDLHGTLTLDHGPGGLRAGPYAVQLGTTLGIGQTAPVTVPLDKSLPAGPWHARLVVTSGQVTRGAEATLTFPTTPGTVGPTVPAKPLPITKRRSVMIPVAGGLLGLLALLFLLFLLWRRRRKDHDEPAKPGSTSERALAESRRG